MPTITSVVPSKVYNTLKYEDYKKLSSALLRIEPYTETIKKVALLSNLPESLIKSIAVVPSEGNNTPAAVKTLSVMTLTDPKKKTSKTALIGGICNVDYSALKAALVQEMKQGRLSEAEKNYLSDDPQLKSILSGTTKLILPTPAAELKAPLFDLNKVQTCLMLSAIMLGQNIDATQNVESGLNNYFKKTDNTTADRNTRFCVAQYGTLDVLENNQRYVMNVPSMISGMRAIWMDEVGNYILARNTKGELINPKTNFVYNAALTDGVKNAIRNGFNTIDLALTDVQDITTKSNYQQQIAVLKEQARQLKLI